MKKKNVVMLIRQIAKDSSISSEQKIKAIDKLLSLQPEKDGGPGSGNFGHKGRPGKIGGSGKGEGGSAGGSSGGIHESTVKAIENVVSKGDFRKSVAEVPKWLDKLPVGTKLKDTTGETYTKYDANGWDVNKPHYDMETKSYVDYTTIGPDEVAGMMAKQAEGSKGSYGISVEREGSGKTSVDPTKTTKTSPSYNAGKENREKRTREAIASVQKAISDGKIGKTETDLLDKVPAGVAFEFAGTSYEKDADGGTWAVRGSNDYRYRDMSSQEVADYLMRSSRSAGGSGIKITRMRSPASAMPLAKNTKEIDYDQASKKTSPVETKRSQDMFGKEKNKGAFLFAMPAGTILKDGESTYVKQHDGSYLAYNGENNGVRVESSQIEAKSNNISISSVPKVNTSKDGLGKAADRDAYGFEKGERTYATDAYSKGYGIAIGKLTEGSGCTGIDPDDLVSDTGKQGTNTLADHCVEVDGKLVLTQERELLHQACVLRAFEGKEPLKEGEKKVAYILGGGSASGKGSFTKPGNEFGIPDNKTQLTIDPDEFKKMIPEYQLEPNRDEAAGYAHEESSSIGKRCTQAAIQNGYNYTVDGTGDGSVKSVMKKINQAREAGYSVEGAYMTCPTDVAIQRSIARGKKTGRVVKIKAIKNIHRDVSRIFPQVAKEFDHIRLYDSNQGDGKPAKLIAECYRGQEITVHDKALYDAFLAKGNE